LYQRMKKHFADFKKITGADVVDWLLGTKKKANKQT